MGKHNGNPDLVGEKIYPIVICLCVFWFQDGPLYYFLNVLRINIYNTLTQHCHCNLLVHTGVVPVNEPSALQLLVRSPAVWPYPSSQVYVTFEL